MAISSRIRRVDASCPESGGGFKANAPAPRSAACRRNETKPSETKRAISRFRADSTPYAAFHFAAPGAAPNRLAAQGLPRFKTVAAAVPVFAKQLSVETAGKRPSCGEAAAGRDRRWPRRDWVRMRAFQMDCAGCRFISFGDSAIRSARGGRGAAASRLERP